MAQGELNMKRSAKPLSFLRDRRGATSIEYGLIAGLIALAVIGAITSIGTATNAAFQSVSEKGWGS
jgi:pilus assembly protein Flp/PilA